MDEEELQVSPELDMSTIKSQPDLPTVSEDPDIREKLKGYFEDKYAMRDARSVESRDQLLSALGKGMNQITGGLTRSTPDSSYYDDLSKNASAPVSAVERREKAIRDYLQAKMQNETQQKGFELQAGKLGEAVRHNREMERLQREAAAKAAREGSPGEKAADVDFAKTIADWTTSGRATADKNITRLNEARKVLEERKGDWVGTSGRVTGRLPDIIRSEESIRLRDDVRAAALASIKAALGPQFTEREGQRIMEMAYNEKLSPKENIAKIDAALGEIQKIYENKEAQLKHWREHGGTMRGYVDSPTMPDTTPGNVPPSTQPGGRAPVDTLPDGSKWEQLPNGDWKRVK